MKFLNIPIQIWDNHAKENKIHPRLINPAHIVSMTPLPSSDGGIAEGTIRTVDGGMHSVPAAAYHETFVAIMESKTTPEQ